MSSKILKKEIKRHSSPLESLERSLKEMNLIRNGKLPKGCWRELMKDLKKV